jgi:hypothetical protein
MNSQRSIFSMAWGRTLFVALWLLYAGVELLLYRWNALSEPNPVPYQLQFYMLPLLAWAGYWFALAGSPYLRPRSVYRHLGLIVLSFAGLFFLTWFWMLFALNIYGS